jgi:hypothetical protein
MVEMYVHYCNQQSIIGKIESHENMFKYENFEVCILIRLTGAYTEV